MSDREAFEVMMKTYFGDVVSLAHDGAVYTDAFAGAVYLGWVEGSLAAQAQAGEGEKVAPCDCIEKVGGFFVSNCYCGNSGDARDAQTYCVLRNATPPAVNQQLLEALVAVRSCMAIGIPEFSLHDREVMIQADNAIDAAIAAAQEVGK